MMFRSHFYEGVRLCEDHGSHISQMAGKTWRDLSPSEKSYWIKKAADRKADFMREHPNWTFKPNKNKTRGASRNVQPITLAQQKKMSIIVSAFSAGKRDQELERLVKTESVDLDGDSVALPRPRPKRSQKAAATKKAPAKTTSTEAAPAPLHSERASEPDSLPSTGSAEIVEAPSPLPDLSLHQELELVSAVGFDVSTSNILTPLYSRISLAPPACSRCMGSLIR
jgi:hypothetical protein